MRITQEQQKAMASLSNSPAFYKLVQLLEDEKAIVLKGLLTAKEHQIGVLQGKGQLLEELIVALK